MINTLLLLVVVAEIAYISYQLRRFEMPKASPEPVVIEPFVTRTDRAFTNENMVGQEAESVIVTPKSPQLIEWEEQEELRKLNLRPR